MGGHRNWPEHMPLARHLVLATEDRERALEAATASISPMEVQFGTSRGAFQFCVSATNVGGLGLRALEQKARGGFKAFVEPTRNCYTLEFSLTGLAGVEHQKRQFSVSPGRHGVISSPSEATSWTDFGQKYRAISVAIDKRALDSKFLALTGHDNPSDIVFDPLIDMSLPHGQSIYRLIDALYHAIDANPALMYHAPISAAAEDLIVTALLTGFPHSHTGFLDGAVAIGNSRTLRAAMEYFEANSGEALTVDQVAYALGTSVRSLQRTFRELKGLSPMQYLREVRLEKARCRLVDPNSDASVTEIAYGCGFTHLGAFSAVYKSRYGESPSETRQKAVR
jgi:AraC-like DNA-binding protein